MLSLLSAVYLQQFPSYSNHNCKKSSFLRTPAFISCFPWGCPCGNHFLFSLEMPLWQSRKTLHEWKDNSVLAKPLAACTIYLQQFPSYSNRKCKKIAVFTYRSPHFLFALGTPLWQSRKTLHECCEVSRVRVMLLMSVAYNFFLFTTRPTILLLA